MNPLHIVYGVIGLLIVGYVWKCESTKTAQAAAVVLAEQARDRALKKAEDDRKAKGKSDEELKVARADNLSLSRKLRDARSRRGFLPSSAASAGSTQGITIIGTDLERALQQLDEGVSLLIAEGDQARVTLDAAKQWSNTVLRQRPPE